MILLSFLSAVLLHECGHLFALTLFHARLLKTKLSPFGITLTHTPLSSPFASLTVASFGPLFGIIGFVATQNSLSVPIFQAVTLSLSLFNLIPITGLDGGRILNAALSFFLPPAAAEAIARITSHLCLVLLWIVGAYLFLFHNASPSLFLMSLALFFENAKNEE